MAAIWNFFRRAGLRVEAFGLSFWNNLRLFFGRAVNTMAVGVIAILVLLAPGALLGWIGYAADMEWLIELGKFAVALGGMIASLAMAVFYFKIGVITTHILVGLDGVIEFLSRGKIKKVFSKETGTSIRHDILNAFAWANAFILWCSIVPVWKTPVAIPLGLTFCLFFAFASAKSWSFVEKPIGKFVVFSLLLIAFGFHTVNVALRGAVSEWVSARGDVAASGIEADSARQNSREQILEARGEFYAAQDTLRIADYRRLGQRRLALISKRNAGTITEAEREELKRVVSRMREIESAYAPEANQFRDEQSGIVGTASGSNSLPASGGGSVMLGASRSAVLWARSNWGLLIIWMLSAFLLAMLIVGLASKRTWLVIASFSGLIFLSVLGIGSWMLHDTMERSAAVSSAPQQEQRAPRSRFISRRAKCRPGLRAEIEDIGRNLDALARQ